MEGRIRQFEVIQHYQSEIDVGQFVRMNLSSREALANFGSLTCLLCEVTTQYYRSNTTCSLDITIVLKVAVP